MMRLAALVAGLFLMIGPACSGSDDDEGEFGNGGGSPTNGNGGQPTNGTGNGGGTTDVVTATDTDQGGEVTDPRDRPERPVWENPTCFGDKPIAAPCEDHCECESGYCYDEAYMAPHRFCTRFCGGVGGGCDDHNGVCLNATSRYLSDYDLTLEWFCMPRCATNADCEAIDPDLVCPRQTMWDGVTLQVANSCQHWEFVED